MASWRLRSADEPAAKLRAFDPDDWILGGRGNPARTQMALDRWHEARWEWVAEDPSHRTIDGADCIDLLFWDEPA
jgi:hypothetical protein